MILTKFICMQSEPKYEFLIKKHEDAGMILDFNNPNAFIESSNTMDDDYENIVIITTQIKKEKI